mmetsp:Transcript_1911/g.4411  ORF Transcript_1911/g.4411 Transcript_1911/m.4411 type:complete len:232 (-) Transcript_1911:522-1217(-)
MGGVSDEREMHHLAARRRAVNRHAEMVLDVAGAEHVAGRVVGRHRTRHELVEDLLHRLAHDVGEDVEAASVRHPERDALAPHLHSPVDHGLDAGDGGLDALEAEAFGDAVLSREEGLEVRREDQAVVHVQDVRLLPLVLVRDLKLVADPICLLHVGDVHELDADGAAVRALERLHDLAQRLRPPLRQHSRRRCANSGGAHEEVAVQVSVAEPVRPMVQERRHATPLHMDVG